MPSITVAEGTDPKGVMGTVVDLLYGRPLHQHAVGFVVGDQVLRLIIVATMGASERIFDVHGGKLLGTPFAADAQRPWQVELLVEDNLEDILLLRIIDGRSSSSSAFEVAPDPECDDAADPRYIPRRLSPAYRKAFDAAYPHRYFRRPDGPIHIVSPR